MSKVQNYLKKKKIQELELPKLYIVKSSPNGVQKPVERQVVEIIENVGLSCEEKLPIDRYRLEDEYPYEVDIIRGETSSRNDGYGSGVGDLWSWSYFSSFSKDEIERYYEKELLRVQNKYLKANCNHDKLLKINNWWFRFKCKFCGKKFRWIPKGDWYTFKK